MFVKRSTGAPRGFFACEAAGLQWLSAADGGVPCARIIAHDDTSLTLERLDTAAPTRAGAHDFGRRLARTHDAGGDAFGAPPDGWTGPGYFGPLQRPLPMSYCTSDRWGSFYAHERLAPMADRAAARLEVPVRDAIDAHFPNAAVLGLDRAIFERLDQYRRARGIRNMDEAIERLLGKAETEAAIGGAA